jgi:hypothetical protein
LALVTLVGGSIVFAAILILSRGTFPDERRAHADAAGQDRGDTAAVPRRGPEEPDTGKVGPPSAGKEMAATGSAPGLAQTTTKEGVKPVRKDGLQFDPDDFERTVRWLDAEVAGLRKDADNGIRYRDAMKKLREEVASHAGIKVRWFFVVQSISTDDVTVLDWYHRRHGESSARVQFSVDSLSGADREGLALRVGRDISEEKAAQLKPKDRITYTAEVRDAEVVGGDDPFSGTPSVRFILKDFRLE